MREKGEIWDHVVYADGATNRDPRVECNYCGVVFHGGALRITAHMCGLKNHGVASCTKIPDNVRESLLAAYESAQSKNDR